MDGILNMFSYVGWVLLAIMILVFVHELGHFLLAKLFKMRVEKFSVGFPPKVIGKTVGETEYVLGLTPLGGYVKISGMVDESMDTDQMASEPQPWEFRSKPVWQRILVIVAGVVFNMILAAIVFVSLKATYGESYIPNLGQVVVADSSIAWEMGLRSGDELIAINDRPVDERAGVETVEQALIQSPLVVQVRREGEVLEFSGPSDMITRLNRAGGRLGLSYDPPVLGTVSDNMPAQAAGLQPGDRITGIGADTVAYWTDLTNFMGTFEGTETTVRFLRPDSISASPAGATLLARSDAGRLYETVVQPEESGGGYVLGVRQILRSQDYGFVAAIGAGLEDTWTNTRVIATSLKRVFTGQENFRENVGGPIMIARVTKQAADAGAPFFWNIVAMLSITLAIINILPIPALDGGHLVFLIYEGIARREPSLKVRMVMQQIGMVLLLAFMVFVIFNDILKL
ncbi:MAG: RIP metalloprotease RseP [Rhodothermales bacterium]|nr:RIP metalloprotease RseP [Rhodothermales bacterium]MBO6779809.1 RIP metalloprotease RseP [Rhodothermales bacterium]